MRILVTGATGFLGAHLCRHLSRDGHEVTALRRATSSTARLTGLQVSERIADVRIYEEVSAAVRGFDAVINAAAEIAYWRASDAVRNSTNVDGVSNVARACRHNGIARMVHVSSVAAIGIPRTGEPPADETFQFNLEESALSYHVSKHRGELALREEIGNGLDAAIVNPAWIFGPDIKGYRGREMVTKAVGRRIVPVFRGGICAVHVDDVVSGICAALSLAPPGERFILGGENLSFREIARRSAAKSGSTPVLIGLPGVVTGAAAIVMGAVSRLTGKPPRISRANHLTAQSCSYYSSDKARAELGYNPRGFDAILDDMFQVSSATSPQAALA